MEGWKGRCRRLGVGGLIHRNGWSNGEETRREKGKEKKTKKRESERTNKNITALYHRLLFASILLLCLQRLQLKVCGQTRQSWAALLVSCPLNWTGLDRTSLPTLASSPLVGLQTGRADESTTRRRRAAITPPHPNKVPLSPRYAAHPRHALQPSTLQQTDRCM